MLVDVIKTRYMSDKIGKYSSPIHCATLTLKEEGIKGFFKGWMPAYWRIGPHTVITFILMERIRTYFGLNTM